MENLDFDDLMNDDTEMEDLKKAKEPTKKAVNFDDFLDDKKPEEKVNSQTGEILSNAKDDTIAKDDIEEETTDDENATTTKDDKNTLTVKDDKNSLVGMFLGKITKDIMRTGEIFDSQDKAIATDVIFMLDKAIKNNGYKWSNMAIADLPNQIKKWSKLGISSQDKLYPDIRKNKHTNKYDVVIKGQYQTVEKLIIKFCSMPIFRFKTDVICVGDEFKYEFDFETGQDKVIEHKKNPKRNQNNLDEIIGAYKIAYVKEKDGRITQLLCVIDKDRIMRAFNSAQTKNVWNNDTYKMVLKTVTWEMWNSEVIRPFMIFPEEIVNDIDIVNESADVDFSNKDFKHKDIDSAQKYSADIVGTGEEIEL